MQEPTSRIPAPSPRSLLREVCGKLLDAGCDENEAIRLLRIGLLQESLERSRGNISRAARKLGRHRNRIAQLLEEFELRRLPAQIRNSQAEQLPLWRRNAKRPPASVDDRSVNREAA